MMIIVHSLQWASKPLRMLALSLTACLALQAAASDQAWLWKIRAQPSSLTFNTTKSGSAGVGGVTETMRFSRFDGGLDRMGRVTLNIDLTSIDSGIPLRDERMQSMLWQVNTYPSATFSAQLSGEDMQKLASETLAIDIDGQLTMAGQKKAVKARLMTLLVGDRLMVSTRQPILIKADDFGIAAGVEALRAVMGLNYLSSTVPVSFQLELGKVAPERAETASSMPVSAW